MELGHGKGEPKADQEKGQLQYWLKALSAPMYDAKNVRIGEEHMDLIPGMVYNIGRSKSSCNIIFQDSRVSRQHCQLYVNPDGKHVYLIDGLVSEILKVNPEVLKNAEHQAREGSKRQGVSSGLSCRKGEVVCRTAADALHEGSPNSGQRLFKRAKSSLNGIYVNGCRLSQVCKVLCSGDIVSLVAPTKGTTPIDPTFGAAVGFFVHGRQQVGGLKMQKSLPSPLANHQDANEAKLRNAVSDGDRQEKTTYLPSQGICGMQELPPHAQVNTVSKGCSTEGADEREGAADHHPRDTSKNSCNGIASSLQTLLADAALLPCRKLSIKSQKFEKFTLSKTKLIEKNKVNNRGQKRHHVDSLMDIEDKREERFTSVGAGAHNVDDALEDAPNPLLEGKECNLVDEGKGKDEKGEDIVHSFLGRGTNLAPVDMHRGALMEKHDKDTVLLPFVEQESYVKATHGLSASGMYESEKMRLRETVRNGFAEACVIPTQLYTNPLSKDASAVALAVSDICSPLLDHHIDHVHEPLIPATTSRMEFLTSDTTMSRSQLAEPGYDQLPSDSERFKFSLSTKKHENESPLPYARAGSSQIKDRVRSTAEILKLISKGAVKKDTEKPPLYFKNPEAPVSISNAKINDESVPQTPEDDILQSLDQEVDAIMLGSPTLQTGGPSQTNRNLEEEANVNPGKRISKTEKDMNSTDLDTHLQLEEEDRLQWARLLSVDGPGLRGFCLNRLKKRIADSGDTEGDISLQQLLAPLDEVVEIFVATFTSNILWFLNSNHFSPELPVTIACHDAERSWSTSPEDRTASPYEGWPNLTVVYPPFPDALAFTSKSKEGFRRGIGCHHPKLFLVRFRNRLRVVISSANLNQRQWLHCTNTVWWKDFSQLQAPNYKALFQPSKSKSSDLFHTTGDFGAQLAYFISRLLTDVPAKAHWIIDLAKYDFSSAEASLVMSIPGIHGTPYPALSRAFLNDLQKGSKFSMKPGITPSKFLGVVSTTVVGISFRFAASADPKGFRIRSLAKLLNSTNKDEDGMLTVFLKRSKNIIADRNAVSVVVSPCPKSSTAQAFLQDAGKESNSSSSSQDGCVQLGFLSRDTAKWVAPLCDGGVCTFLARIWPKEALAIASGLSENFVRLALHVFEGSRFGELRTSPPTSQQAIALSRLLCALQYSFGLHRLEQVLSRYRWPNSVETDFVFGSSSVGTSLDAPFLAAFSAAAGRRATAFSASEESDSQWGRWTENHEAENPSVGVVFPTVERAKASTEGPLSHLGVLCFAEKAWEKLKPAKILHDAVPYPPTRDGIPMHSKVAMRRFQYSPHGTSFGWVYCGSHNFSPAAWGRPLPKCPVSVAPVLGTPMLISNYELGLLFVDPPPLHAHTLDTIDDFSPEELAYVAAKDESKYKLNGEAGDPRVEGLDRFKLPFVMPPPKYKASDQPATGKALYGILLTLRSECKSVEEAAELEDRLLGNADSESDESEPDEDSVPTTIGAEATGGLVGETAPANMEQQYAEALWSQIEQY